MSELCIVIENEKHDIRLTIKRDDKGELVFEIASIDTENPWGEAEFRAKPERLMAQLKAVIETKG